MTLWSNPVIHVVAAGSEYRAVILPTIYTKDGVAVTRTEDEVLSRYNEGGGYSGTAKHLGVIAGGTINEARLNARDYAFLLSFQQNLIMRKRFPGFSFSSLVNTPGSTDSNW
jgi:hypothetical protein